MTLVRGISTGDLKCFVLVVAVVLSFATCSFGQSATGQITGTLTDAQGAAMVGANVVVRNTATGVEKAATSNDAGIYTAPLLQPGPTT